MTRSRRLGPMVGAVIVGAFVVAGPAYAADPPPAPGTGECEQQVALDTDVVAAKAVTPPDPTAVAAAEKKATDSLCTGTTEPGASTPPASAAPGAADPASPESADGTPDTPGRSNRLAPSAGGNQSDSAVTSPAPKRAGRPAGDRDCPDFATQQQAQQYFLSIGGSPTNNADRLDANHNGIACEDYFDDGDNQEAAVSTTGDDGSEARTSGDQVTDVPEGSAQTGGF